MANIVSARKRARQAEVHRKHNASLRSALRTRIKNVHKAIIANNKADAEAAYKLALPALDKAVTKGLIHGNKAARHKSRLNAHVRAL